MKKIYPYIISIVLFNLLLIGGSIFSGLGKGDVTYYFKEAKAVTFFCALFLGLTSFLAAILFYLHTRIKRNQSSFNFWGLSAFGFFYLMLDEFFMIHEGMDRAILKSLDIPARAYNFDGWIIALFGLIGAGFIFKFKNELIHYKNFIKLTVLGFIFLILMVAADQSEHLHLHFKVLDDSFKIIGASFFLAGYLSVLSDDLHECFP